MTCFGDQCGSWSFEGRLITSLNDIPNNDRTGCAGSNSPQMLVSANPVRGFVWFAGLRVNRCYTSISSEL